MQNPDIKVPDGESMRIYIFFLQLSAGLMTYNSKLAIAFFFLKQSVYQVEKLLYNI